MKPVHFIVALSSILATTFGVLADDDPHTIADPLAAEAALLTAGFTSPVALAAPAPAQASQGKWGPVIPWDPHIPVTAATLPDGRLLTFSSNRRTTFPEGPEFTYASVWDPATGAFTEINNDRHDMFCGGTVMLPDGRVVINGGRNTTNLSSIFDYRTSQWNALQNMNDPRWYNTSVGLPDGTVFTVSGSGGSNTAELWNSSSGWRRLTGVNWSAVTSQPGYINIWHPLLALAPNGKLFHFGPTDVMNWVTTTGSGSLAASGQNVPGPYYPKEGAWAMYDEGKILVAGGSANTTANPNDDTTGTSTNAAYTVNLNGPTPVVTPATPMLYRRQFANSVVLPNGEILVIGGNTSGLKFNDTGSIMTPEIWTPGTGTWRSVADMTIPRNYHSLALLLPDGRVWSGGSGLGGNAADHRNAQIFTPPALMADDGSLATRPVISDGPDIIGPGTRFTIRATPGLTRFSFIRMSSQTHSVNTDLRYLTLPFTEISPGIYTLTGRINSNVMTPGYWMLFGLNSEEVHSKARIVHVSLNSGTTARNPGNQQSFPSESVELPILIAALPQLTIQFSATGLPSGLTIHPTTGLISGTITAAPGTYPVSVVTTPSSGLPLTVTFEWKVLLPNYGNGKIRREWYLDVNGPAIADLTSNAAYPANPTDRDFLTSFEAPPNTGDNYGQRVRGYLHPITTGTYRFWIAGDDQCRLLLSSNDDPANAVPIASVLTWSGSREWTRRPEQESAPVTLEGGKRYYIEALMKDELYDDYLAVGWQPPGTGAIEVIPGQNLSPYDPVLDPVATWHFDEPVWNGTATEVKEASGKVPSIHGTTAGGAVTSASAPVFTGNPGTGRFGRFDGSGQYVSIPFNSTLNPDDFTVSAWLHPFTQTSPGSRTAFSSRQAAAGETPGFTLSASAAGNWTFLTSSSSPGLVGPPISPNTWSHLAISFRTISTTGGVRTGVRRIFVNGIQVAEDTANYVPASTSPLLIGASSLAGGPGDFMSGGIDEINVHAMPLSAADVAGIRNLRHRLNSSPAITSPGPLANSKNSSIALAIVANDTDGDPITFSASSLPDGLSISPSSGVISGSCTTSGEFNVTVTATDLPGDTSSVSFLWSVVENLSVLVTRAAPSPAGTNIGFNATGSGGKNPRYQWNFGDGSPDTSFTPSPAITHTFPGPGRYLVTVTATDDTGSLVSNSFYQAIHAPLTTGKPTKSSSICHERRTTGNDRVWVVNPDNDSVTVIDAVTHLSLAEIPVGTSPRCLAVAPDGRIWVTNAISATLSILSPDTFTVLSSITLPSGSRPFGIAFAPSGAAAFVTLEDAGRLLKLDPVSGAQLASTDVGKNVRHLSLTEDGSRAYISRFITPPLPGEATLAVSTDGRGGEVIVVDPASNTIERTLLLHHSEEPDTSNSAHGIPNYLGAPAISPDGLSAWIPSKQDNIKRGKLRNNQDLTHDMSVRAIASRLDLTLQSEDRPARVDFDNAGVPSAIAFDPWGIYAFVALEASRSVAVVDVWNQEEILRFNVGRAPQGLAVSPDGLTLFVHNFMDRSITIHNLAMLIDGTVSAPPLAVTVSTVTTDKLPPQTLLGKQLFYDAKDNRLALQEYLSCASCHNDGGEDGRVWDFTGFGEGLRNTITLRGHGGTRQGPLHWSGNFDEVQDFENQIRNFAGGTGLVTGSPHPPLGSSNAGRSPDLDAMAAYLQSLNQTEKSPLRASDGSLSSAARAGELVFRTLDCASCHGGTEFSLSATGNLPNIGTLKPSSGKRLGGNLTGIDIPTLRGIWNTAPYLHDGSAATLAQAVSAHQGVSVAATDLANLVAYIESIDDLPATAPLPKTQFAGWAQTTPGADGNPTSNADGDLFPDLLEFALDGLPDSGASPANNAISLEEVGGNFTLIVRRPSGLSDLTYEVLASGNLSSWTVAPAPIIQSAGNGFELLRFENLQNLPGLSLDSGFARLRVTGASSAATSLPLGWQAVSFGITSRTVGIPFREDPLFASTVNGTSGMRLLVNGTPPSSFVGFVEVVTGPHAGHRFEVASSAAGEITLKSSLLNTLTTLPDLTGAQVVFCTHHTLGGIFNKTLFKGSTNPAAADQIQFYTNNGTIGQFQLYYLLDARPGNATHQWRAFLPGGGDQGTRVISPGEGILMKRPTAAPAARIVLRGQVRANPFIQPLQRGTNLVGSPFPTPLTPRSRGLLDPAAAFIPSTNINAADQFQLFQSGAFRVFYLLDHPTQADPWRETVPGSPNYNDLPLFEPTSGTFLKRNQPALSYTIPPSWTP